MGLAKLVQLFRLVFIVFLAFSYADIGSETPNLSNKSTNISKTISAGKEVQQVQQEQTKHLCEPVGGEANGNNPDDCWVFNTAEQGSHSAALTEQSAPSSKNPNITASMKVKTNARRLIQRCVLATFPLHSDMFTTKLWYKRNVIFSPDGSISIRYMEGDRNFLVPLLSPWHDRIEFRIRRLERSCIKPRPEGLPHFLAGPNQIAMSYAQIDDNDKKMNFDNNSLIQNISVEGNVKKWGGRIKRSTKAKCLLCRTYLNLRNLIKFRRQTAEQLPRYNGESDVFVTITTASNASQSTISYNRFYTTTKNNLTYGAWGTFTDIYLDEMYHTGMCPVDLRPIVERNPSAGYYLPFRMLRNEWHPNGPLPEIHSNLTEFVGRYEKPACAFTLIFDSRYRLLVPNKMYQLIYYGTYGTKFW